MHSVIKYLLVMAAGYGLRRAGKAGARDVGILSAIMMYITLPCSMAACTENITADPTLLLLALLAFFIGAGMMLLGWLLGRGKEEKMLLMVHLSSLNIGGFTVPFMQDLLPSSAVAFSGMYDLGNSGYGNGASYWIPKAMKDGDGKFHIQKILLRLCRSVPLVTYLVFMLLAFAGVRLTASFFNLVRSVGSCNFLIVFLIAGITLNLKMSRGDAKTIGKFVAIKYGAGALLAALAFRFLPLPLLARQAVVFCILAPQASTSVAYSEMLGCPSSVYSGMYTSGLFGSMAAYAVLGLIFGL